MGGVLVGGAITRAPDAFGAAIIQAGELNPTRLEAAPNGANQFAEVGDPHTSEGLHMAAAMDPYQRIKDATDYPAVLLIVGLNDNRVAPWESGKIWGAARSPQANGQRPVWFRTNADMGHALQYGRGCVVAGTIRRFCICRSHASLNRVESMGDSISDKDGRDHRGAFIHAQRRG